MTQFVCLPLEYSDQMQFYYQKLGELPGFVLLESTDKSLGRYDILSAYPYDRIEIYSDTKDKWEQLNKLSSQIAISYSALDLPFQGGAMGYISYDLGAHLQGIESIPQPSLKDLPLLDMGLYDWAIITDHQLKKVTLFAANQHQATRAIIDEVNLLWESASNTSSSFIIKKGFQPLIAEKDYAQSFDTIQTELKAGRCYQVNYTQPFHASYEGDVWQMYRQVSKQNPVPFSAYIKTKNADIVSFSPERFMSYDQGTLLTSPIKGTIKRSVDPIEDGKLQLQLEQCTKNRAENVMIVDLMRNDFGKIAKVNSVQVPKLCAVQSFNAVHHLVSDIKAECMDNVTPLQAFLSCFPGGSITGAPKLEAMRVIAEQETFARGLYCGSIGYFSRHGRFDTNIAIRTITAKEGILHLAAGGGIVIDSKVDDEYQECYTKIAAIINGLQ